MQFFHSPKRLSPTNPPSDLTSSEFIKISHILAKAMPFPRHPGEYPLRCFRSLIGMLLGVQVIPSQIGAVSIKEALPKPNCFIQSFLTGCLGILSGTGSFTNLIFSQLFSGKSEVICERHSCKVLQQQQQQQQPQPQPLSKEIKTHP